MFREMRRFRQAMTAEQCAEALEHGTSGVLAVAGDDGYPYAVPLSYLYLGGKLYFHCAKSGYKLDALRSNAKVCFCVTDKDEVVPEKYTTYYRSVTLFGRARVIADDTEKREYLGKLAAKYSPNDERGCREEVEKSLARVCVVEVTVEHMTGKEAIELIEKRPQSGAAKTKSL
jgi:uncharacterized protein